MHAARSRLERAPTQTRKSLAVTSAPSPAPYPVISAFPALDQSYSMSTPPVMPSVRFGSLFPAAAALPTHDRINQLVLVHVPAPRPTTGLLTTTSTRTPHWAVFLATISTFSTDYRPLAPASLQITPTLSTLRRLLAFKDLAATPCSVNHRNQWAQTQVPPPPVTTSLRLAPALSRHRRQSPLMRVPASPTTHSPH